MLSKLSDYQLCKILRNSDYQKLNYKTSDFLPYGFNDKLSGAQATSFGNKLGKKFMQKRSRDQIKSCSLLAEGSSSPSAGSRGCAGHSDWRGHTGGESLYSFSFFCILVHCRNLVVNSILDPALICRWILPTHRPQIFRY